MEANGKNLRRNGVLRCAAAYRSAMSLPFPKMIDKPPNSFTSTCCARIIPEFSGDLPTRD